MLKRRSHVAVHERRLACLRGSREAWLWLSWLVLVLMLLLYLTEKTRRWRGIIHGAQSGIKRSCRVCGGGGLHTLS